MNQNIKVSMKDKVFTVTLLKQQEKCLQDAATLTRMIAGLHPLEERTQKHADTAATGLEALLLRCARNAGDVPE